MECAMCLDAYNNKEVLPASLQCGHIFCMSCLGQLASLKCPQCRRPFDKGSIRRVFLESEPVEPAAASTSEGDVCRQAERLENQLRLAKDLTVEQQELLLKRVRTWMVQAVGVQGPSRNLKTHVANILSASGQVQTRLGELKCQTALQIETNRAKGLEAETKTLRQKLVTSQTTLSKQEERQNGLIKSLKEDQKTAVKKQEKDAEKIAELQKRIVQADRSLSQMRTELQQASIRSSPRTPVPKATGSKLQSPRKTSVVSTAPNSPATKVSPGQLKVSSHRKSVKMAERAPQWY